MRYCCRADRATCPKIDLRFGRICLFFSRIYIEKRIRICYTI